MPLITDKFGKSSIPTDVAVATTVKTTRLPGVFVLEAFDLSKYAIDTPVFVVTYKKTTDPGTGIVSITSLKSWKALVNPGANTLTNLTVQPGYTDTGNDVGDFIECIPTSAWENSLIDGILTSLNPDGTLKTSAVQQALNITGGAPPDWTILANPPTLITPNGNRNYTFQFTGVDVTSFWAEGMKVRGIRSSVVPTQAATTNGTTSYLTKAAPNKMIFTDNFTLGTVFRLPAYPTVGNKYLFGRSDSGATGGFAVGVNPSGQLLIFGANAGGGNYRIVNTYLRLSLNRTYKVWFTWAAGVINIYIDGQLIAGLQVSTSGTAPTTIQQVGDFAIGRLGANTTTHINAEISQVSVFDAVLSQATIRNYDTIGLSGTEPNLKSAWSLNNILTDLNTLTPNDLSNINSVTFAEGGAFANRGASTTLEYGQVVSKPVFSGGNTTFNVQAPQGCAFPHGTGTITSLYYSATDAPFGYPKQSIFMSEFIQQAMNWNSISPGAGNFKLDSSGACLGIYVPFDCDIEARIDIGVGATSDFECRPSIWIDGTAPGGDQYYSPAAALGNAGGRAMVRGFTSKVRVTAGWHLISAGVELISGGGYFIAAGGINLVVKVPVKVMV